MARQQTVTIRRDIATVQRRELWAITVKSWLFFLILRERQVLITTENVTFCLDATRSMWEIRRMGNRVSVSIFVSWNWEVRRKNKFRWTGCRLYLHVQIEEWKRSVCGRDISLLDSLQGALIIFRVEHLIKSIAEWFRRIRMSHFKLAARTTRHWFRWTWLAMRSMDIREWVR